MSLLLFCCVCACVHTCVRVSTCTCFVVPFFALFLCFLRPSYTRQHCCWKLLLATMFPRYFASKFVAKLPAVVTFGVMNNNDLTWKNHVTPTNYIIESNSISIVGMSQFLHRRNTLQTGQYLALGTLSRILNATIMFYG